MIPTLLIPSHPPAHPVITAEMPAEMSEAFGALFETVAHEAVLGLSPEAVPAVTLFPMPSPPVSPAVGEWRAVPQAPVSLKIPDKAAPDLPEAAGRDAVMEPPATGAPVPSLVQMSPPLQPQPPLRAAVAPPAKGAVLPPADANLQASSGVQLVPERDAPLQHSPDQVPTRQPTVNMPHTTTPVPSAPAVDVAAPVLPSPQSASADPPAVTPKESEGRLPPTEWRTAEPAPPLYSEADPALPAIVRPEGQFATPVVHPKAPVAQLATALPAEAQPTPTSEPPFLPPISQKTHPGPMQSVAMLVPRPQSERGVPERVGTPQVPRLVDLPEDPLAPPTAGPARTAESALRFAMQLDADVLAPVPDTAPKGEDRPPLIATPRLDLPVAPSAPVAQTAPLPLAAKTAKVVDSPDVPKAITPKVLNLPTTEPTTDLRPAPHAREADLPPDSAPSLAPSPAAPLATLPAPVPATDTTLAVLSGVEPLRTLLPGTPQASPQPVAATVAPQIAAALPRADDGPVEITLSPVELGRLRIELVTEGDHLRVSVAVERPETLELFRRNAEVLMAEIRQAGFSGAQLSFGNWSGEQGARQSPETPDESRSGPAPDLPFAPLQPLPPSRAAHGGGLDLRL